MLCGRLPQTPRRQRPPLDGLERPSGRKQPPAGTTPDRSSCRRTSTSEHPGKAGRPARRDPTTHHRQEEKPIT